jgi:hypothetical protein
MVIDLKKESAIKPVQVVNRFQIVTADSKAQARDCYIFAGLLSFEQCQNQL